MIKNHYSIGLKKYYKNRACTIIKNSGHIYFVIVQFEDGSVDSVLKYDLRDEPTLPFKIRLIRLAENILHCISLGDYQPHFT
jgi:hypothetical protein